MTVTRPSLSRLAPQVESQPTPAAITVLDQTVTLSALPATVDLRLYRGDDFIMTLTVTDPDGLPVDLESGSVEAHVRAEPDAEDFGEFTARIDANLITLHLRSDVSATLPLTAVWDCRLDFGGLIQTLVAGSLTLTRDVTRD